MQLTTVCPGFMALTENMAAAASSSVIVTVPAAQLLLALSVVSEKAARDAVITSTLTTRSDSRAAA
jgi:hypothetical protein